VATCLTIGGILTQDQLDTISEEVSDLSEALDGLITSLLAQGVEGHLILEDVKQAIEKNELQLELLNLRTEEAYNTKLDEKDIT